MNCSRGSIDPSGIDPNASGVLGRFPGLGSLGSTMELLAGRRRARIVDGSIGDFSAGCSIRFFTAVGPCSTCCACLLAALAGLLTDAEASVESPIADC
jgi:hypothetical protein